MSIMFLSGFVRPPFKWHSFGYSYKPEWLLGKTHNPLHTWWRAWLILLLVFYRFYLANLKVKPAIKHQLSHVHPSRCAVNSAVLENTEATASSFYWLTQKKHVWQFGSCFLICCSFAMLAGTSSAWSWDAVVNMQIFISQSGRSVDSLRLSPICAARPWQLDSLCMQGRRKGENRGHCSHGTPHGTPLFTNYVWDCGITPGLWRSLTHLLFESAEIAVWFLDFGKWSFWSIYNIVTNMYNIWPLLKHSASFSLESTGHMTLCALSSQGKYTKNVFYWHLWNIAVKC